MYPNILANIAAASALVIFWLGLNKPSGYPLKYALCSPIEGPPGIVGVGSSISDVGVGVGDVVGVGFGDVVDVGVGVVVGVGFGDVVGSGDVVG